MLINVFCWYGKCDCRDTSYKQTKKKKKYIFRLFACLPNIGIKARVCLYKLYVHTARSCQFFCDLHIPFLISAPLGGRTSAYRASTLFSTSHYKSVYSNHSKSFGRDANVNNNGLNTAPGAALIVLATRNERIQAYLSTLDWDCSLSPLQYNA